MEQGWEQQGPQSHVIPWTCSSDKGQEVGMGQWWDGTEDGSPET